jgi:hypothetical protein
VLVRWREAERLDWTMIEEAVCLWAAGHPAGTAGQAIADLRLPYPADKEMIRCVRAVIGRHAAVGPQVQEILRAEWGGLYEISTCTRGRLTARRLDGTGEILTAASPDELRSRMLRDSGLVMFMPLSPSGTALAA